MDQILCQRSFRSPLDLPLDRIDASSIAVQLFLAGGLRDLNGQELQRTLAEKIVSLKLAMLDDSFALYGNTRPQDFDVQMQLLTAMITAPGWRSDGFANAIEVLSQSLNASAALSTEVDNQKGKELRYSGDPRWRTPAPAELTKWTFNEARTFFDLILTNSPLEIIVVGDVSVDRVIDAVGKLLEPFHRDGNCPNLPTREK